MYIPAAFKVQDPASLFDLIEKNSFALLISQHDGEPFGSHLPLLLDRGAAPGGSLVGHMARANPQWKQAEGQTVLAVFSGPHAYISPNWYKSEEVVPTWNYAAVHVYGTFRAIQDHRATARVLSQTVARYEGSMPSPWKFDAESEFSRRMIGAVVAFHVEISRIEGKLKMNQNQPTDRRRRVVRALRAAGDPMRMEVAGMVAKTMQPKP